VRAARLVLPLVALSFGVGACGGDGGDERTRYPSAVEQNFTKACNASSKGKEDACKCALAKLEDTVPYAEFKKADDVIRGGGTADPATTDKLNAAIKACT
jgi:hypothetical protein